jgi:hypothetical protein
VINSLLSVGNFPIYSYTDLGYPNAINGDANLSVDDRVGAAEFLKDIGLNADGSPAPAGAANGHGLAGFNYMVLPEDHTTGLGATFTPRAEVAQNDAALGEILPALSSYDQNARPLYDLFQNKDEASQLTGADLTPFTPVADPPFINERVADLPQTAATEDLVRQSKAMPKAEDTQGPILEQIDWQATTNRPIPPALNQEVAKSRSGTDDKDD